MFILWAIRFFLFKLYESPKYLMGRGRDEAAVEVVHLVAEHNGTTSSLTVEDLKNAGSLGLEEGPKLDASAAGAVKRQLAKFNGGHVRSLFATKKLAYSTSLLIILWGGTFLNFSFTKIDYATLLAFIGLAFPLYGF